MSSAKSYEVKLRRQHAARVEISNDGGHVVLRKNILKSSIFKDVNIGLV